MFRKIIIPLDGTLLAEEVLPWVQQITKADETEIVLVYNLADSPVPEVTDPTGETAEEIAHHLYGPIQVYLNQQRDQLEQVGYRVDVQSVKDGTASQIVRAAAGIDADLIAMATHGRSPIGRWVLGSVADAVLHRAQQPVYLVRAGIAPPQHTLIQRILLPLDGSGLSEQSLPVARGIATAFDAHILLMQVIPATGTVAKPSPLMTHEARTTDSSTRLIAVESYLEAQQVALQASGVNCDREVLVGEPAAAIVAASKENQSDIIVMATHARTGLDRFLQGSVAGNVLHDSVCPLLLVK